MSEWFIVQPSRAAPKLTLYCLPYAGGDATIYHGWGAQLPDEVELRAVRLPGRGRRRSEPLITEMSVLVDALLGVIEKEQRYGFFGHSLGGRIAFELTRALARRALPLPAKLWISGSRAPQLPRRRPPIHDLREAEF